MEQTKDVLETLAQQQGVNVAMIVSRDGFILEMETGRGMSMEPETLGAAVSIYWTTADSMGRELEAGLGLNGLIEFKDALISTALLEENDVILTIVADRNVNPATIRYLTTKFSQLLEYML